MGQAAVDLPDPLDRPAGAPGAATPLPDADDLLAQLAGDEIERLLSEADLDVPADPAPRPVAAPRAPIVAPAGCRTAIHLTFASDGWSDHLHGRRIPARSTAAAELAVES